MLRKLDDGKDKSLIIEREEGSQRKNRNIHRHDEKEVPLKLMEMRIGQ
jgi:hypothetical protein